MFRILQSPKEEFSQLFSRMLSNLSFFVLSSQPANYLLAAKLGDLYLLVFLIPNSNIAAMIGITCITRNTKITKSRVQKLYKNYSTEIVFSPSVSSI